VRGSGPHLTHGSLTQPESATQTVSRSVHPFLQGVTTVTDRQTDRPCYSVCNNYWSPLADAAMRPNNEFKVAGLGIFAILKDRMGAQKFKNGLSDIGIGV